MTAQQFTAWAEAVYGKYTQAMKREVEIWLDANKKNDRWIDALRQVVLQEHPSTFRVPPGVHEIFAMRIQVHAESHKLEEASAKKELPLHDGKRAAAGDTP
jgi:hypothetical protein